MRRWILSGLLLVALIVTGVWGYNQYLENQDHLIRTENLYKKSFYELVGRVDNIESGLSKVMISSDQGQSIEMLSDVWRQADSAGTNLGQLPLSHIALNKTSKFLSQLTDYCRFLTLKAGEGRPLSLDEMNNLKELKASSVRLGNELRVLETGVNEGRVTWQAMRDMSNEGLKDISGDILTKQFTKIEETSIEYPSLIYDGPFSETLLRPKKLGISGKTVDYKEAEAIAMEFLGKDRIEGVGEGAQTQGDIETWGVDIETRDGEGPFFVSVSKIGGRVVSLISGGTVDRETISLDDALKKAQKFLEEKGFEDMEATYGQHNDGTAVFNFVYKDGDVIIYPDLVKVKVSLGSGNIVGFEGLNFLTAHKNRNLKKPKLSLEEAKKLINRNLNISSERLAVIPGKAGNEIQCYEFKGKFDGEDFIIYINSDNGKEEEILKVLDTGNGTLVI